MNQYYTKAGNSVKRRYRINKKKLAVFMAVFCIAVAALTVGIYFLTKNDKNVVLPASAQQQQRLDEAQAMIKGTDAALDGKVIVVDAGHGGFDPGAIGVSGVHEDELNLKVARYLEAELKAAGAEVIMTRIDENAIAENKELDMAKRRQIIQESGSDIVVSVHMNWFDDPEISGPVVIFMDNSVAGEKLALQIQQSLNDALEPQTAGKARSGKFYILKSGYQPCVIMECGYLSNHDEEQKLKQDDYQRRIAKAACEGIMRYFLE